MSERERRQAHSQVKLSKAKRINANFLPTDFKIGNQRDMTPNRLNPSFRYEGAPMTDTKAFK